MLSEETVLRPNVYQISTVTEYHSWKSRGLNLRRDEVFSTDSQSVYDIIREQ